MNYEEVIQKLNSLIEISNIRAALDGVKKTNPVEVMKSYLRRIGISNEMLNELSVVHVTGTKGKGSTSAICESILRAHGYRTGFLSSPHLVTPRERIRICGKIISEDSFTKYFNEIYSLLKSSKSGADDIPGYYGCIALMAFKVFIDEKLDVAILEVFVGGIRDITNVVRNVPSVGIASIGLDHVTVLGDTKEKIALAKSGIMKPGCTAYTVEQQPSVLEVLKMAASKTQCSLHVVPSYEDYEWEANETVPPKLATPELKINASLGIQLAHCWMDQHKRVHQMVNGVNCTIDGHQETTGGGIVTRLAEATALGVTNFRWPGRYQTIHLEFADLYLDGAHTIESIAACIKWFNGCTSNSSRKSLLFNTSRRKCSEALMDLLLDMDFERVFFAPNIASKSIDSKHGQFSFISREEQLEKCEMNRQYWRDSSRARGERCCHTHAFEFVTDFLQYLEQDSLNTGHKPSVLITGSLHLVGAVLSLVEPEFLAKI